VVLPAAKPVTNSLGKPTRCRVIPGRPALLGGGGPRPSRTAPLGMTKTPTLRVSADMLVSHRACAGGSSFRLPPGKHLPAIPGRPGTPPRCHRRAAKAQPQALLLRHPKIAAVVRGEWSPQPRVTQSHSIFNSNKQYIYVHTVTLIVVFFRSAVTE
jgi:hypothetical protein